MNILSEYDDDQALEVEHIYVGIDRVASIVAGDDIYYVCSDQISSSRAVVDEGGVVNQRRDYYPFGETEYGTGAVSEFQFSSKERDGTGLYYFGARYHDPEIGRWLSVDPLWDKYPGWSPYVYALDNPLRYVDPTGTIIETTEDDMEYLISALPEGAEDYMQLTDEGYIDTELLSQFESDDAVFQSVLEVAQSDKIVGFRLDSKFDYVSDDGTIQPNVPLASPEGEIKGFFLHPDNSVNGETAILISQFISDLDKARMIGHEFVHGAWYVRGDWLNYYPFHFTGKFYGKNRALKNMQITNENVAKQNYLKRFRP